MFSKRFPREKHPRFGFAPRDDRSSKNEPNRVENDRDTSLQSWKFLTLFLPRRLGCVIGDAEDLTAQVARDLRRRDLPKTLTKIESSSFATIRDLARVRLSQAVLECAFRVCRLAFRICAFALLLTCATGGHIAHIHFRNVLWFLTLLEKRYPSESSEYLHVFIVDSPKTDVKYSVIVWIMVAARAELKSSSRRQRARTSLQRGCSARARSRKSIHASER